MDSVPITQPNDGSPSDQELWFALQSGQTEALGLLYDRHASLVYGISLKVLGNAQEAEDLTQDIFVKLAQQASYDPKRGSLRTFLMILTRSRAIDRVRSRQSSQTNKARWQADYLPPTPSLSADDMIEDEQSQDIKAALAQLSEQQQQVLYLAYYEGFTQTAIADQLNAPLSTIKARARRGLRQLRRILQEQEG
ncbi:MAG: sigma-70 family RNA polymerase sigma factor [Phormidesmis sp.]